MMNSFRLRSWSPCVLALWALACGPVFSQSLEEIIQNRPEVTQPATGQVPETAPVPAAAPAAPEAGETSGNLDAIRAKIIEHAEGMVGKVLDSTKGEDGFKVGWQHLKEFYEVAYRLENLEKDRPQWMSGIKGVGKKVSDWCGIFSVWAWRKAGVPVYWNTKVIGCKYRGNKDILAQGDIVVIKDKDPEKPLNHHCMVKSIDGQNMTTVDGNQGPDSIKVRTRKLSDIAILYSVAEAMGAKPQASPAQKPSATTKPAPATQPAKPDSGTTGSSGTSGKPGATAEPAPQQPLSPQQMEDLINKVMTILRATLGNLF